MMADDTQIARLSRRQLGLCALTGAAFWFAAALLCGFLGPRGAYEGVNRIILYLLVILGTVPVVLLVGRIAGLARSQLGLGLAVGTATATLFDGLALAWWPALYGGPPYVAGAGAVILWGAGVGLVLGFWMARQR